MDLKKIKQLEDLKEKYNSKMSIYNAKVIDKKREFLIKIKNDFINYFKYQDFEIIENGLAIISKYKTAIITLSLPKENDIQLGGLSLELLKEINDEKKNIKVLIFQKSNNIKFNLNNEPLTDNEKLEKDIEIYKNKLNNFEEKLKTVDNLEFKLVIIKEDKTKEEFNDFISIIEVL
jgi:hypothetical protein